MPVPHPDGPSDGEAALPPPTAEAADAPPSGSARRARERRARALARHVAWLAQIVQTQSCHHSGLPVASSFAELSQLRTRITVLEANSTAPSASSPPHPAENHDHVAVKDEFVAVNVEMPVP